MPVDPLAVAAWYWPQVHFYAEQRRIIESVWNDAETVVAAGNKLGKDFVAAFVVLAFFLTRTPCRIVTTSAKDDHLAVLWGEMNWFLNNSVYPLRREQGGPLLVYHREMRKLTGRHGLVCPISYVRGMVASDQAIAAMGGHHADPKVPDGQPHTLFVADEASSVPDDYYKIVSPWAKRMLIIGNPWPCENFFRKAVRKGSQPAPDGSYYRRVYRIRATDSPNVRLALAEQSAGRTPSHRVLVPGVKDYAEYLKNRATWDVIQQTVSLDAEFYEGLGALMFPVAWLNRAHAYAADLAARNARRLAKTIGVDPAEGGDKTSMAAVDEHGLIELTSRQTPDTAVVTAEAIAFGRKHGVPPERWYFDRGGGGKQHADRLREMGYAGVQTVAFGESVMPDVRRWQKVYQPYKERLDQREEKYAYVNRRSEMYGILRECLDPGSGYNHGKGFALPREYGNLRDELAPIPLTYDAEGRLKLLPKQKEGADATETLIGLIGHSPDEADATVLAVWGMLEGSHGPARAGAF